jgi:DtxR family Mn-dependent transcriptional regulator
MAVLQGKTGTGSRPTPSQEHYLRAILEVAAAGAGARVGEVARQLGVTKATISAALRTLEGQGLVRHPRYGRVDLTDKGRLHAQQVMNRFAVLRYFLEAVLELDPQTAYRDACLMEHSASGETIDRLTVFSRFFTENRSGRAALGKFGEFRRSCEPEECPVCVFPCGVNLAKPAGWKTGQGKRR